jgi:hypothetical protein
MASINFTSAAKEDSRSIFADLETKAGAYTVENTSPSSADFMTISPVFPKAVHRAASWGQPFVLASFFRMSCFIATSKPTIPCLFSAF